MPDSPTPWYHGSFGLFSTKIRENAQCPGGNDLITVIGDDEKLGWKRISPSRPWEFFIASELNCIPLDAISYVEFGRIRHTFPTRISVRWTDRNGKDARFEFESRAGSGHWWLRYFQKRGVTLQCCGQDAASFWQQNGVYVAIPLGFSVFFVICIVVELLVQDPQNKVAIIFTVFGFFVVAWTIGWGILSYIESNN